MTSGAESEDTGASSSGAALGAAVKKQAAKKAAVVAKEQGSAINQAADVSNADATEVALMEVMGPAPIDGAASSSSGSTLTLDTITAFETRLDALRLALDKKAPAPKVEAVVPTPAVSGVVAFAAML